MDLSRAVIESLEKGNAITNAVSQTVQWLARERIDKSEFKYCIDQARGLTYPNSHGLQIRTSLMDCENKYAKVSGLKLIQSGSVGRWMAFDMDYCYMVTTVAAIMIHHEYQFAADALCNMIVDDENQDHSGGKSYNIRKTRLKPVLSKIVESIALNVVNSGHGVEPLPREVADLCVHITSASAFAAVVMAVQRSSNDILLYCGRFHGDIFVWLISHFDGVLELSVAGRIIYDKALGEAKARVTMIVREICDVNASSHVSKDADIEITINLGKGQFKTIFRQDPVTNVKGPQATKRQQLYSIDEINVKEQHSILSHSEMNDVRLTAQAMADWLLQVALKHGNDTDVQFCFKQATEENEQRETLNIGSLLQRWPRVTHKKYGQKPKTLCVFRSPSEGLPELDDESSNPSRSKAICEIINCFPVAMDLFDNIKPRCPCTSCRRNWNIGEGKYGCLRETALAELLALLAHTIADGFGAPDVSGLVEAKDRKAGFQRLFTELIWDGLVVWDTWFTFAASTFLGCAWNNSMIEDMEGATSVIVVQYGSLVAASTWINMSEELSGFGCFGFSFAEGRVQGIVSEFAVVQAERTMKISQPCPSQQGLISQTSNTTPVDTSFAGIEVALIGASQVSYRLLTMVKSDTARRIVDPTAAIVACCSSFFPACEHARIETYLDSAHDSVWSFDELLGGWSRENKLESENKGMIVSTTLIETTQKFNVALSLSPQGCVVQNPSCCFTCAKGHLARHPSKHGKRIIRRAGVSNLMQQMAI
ncbi:hypothetical protein ACLMJK_001312 [Lecanora helva]